jgi:hypothetical protein
MSEAFASSYPYPHDPPRRRIAVNSKIFSQHCSDSYPGCHSERPERAKNLCFWIKKTEILRRSAPQNDEFSE